MPSVGNKYYRINSFPKNSRIVFLKHTNNLIDEEGIAVDYWDVVARRWAYVEHKNGRSVWNSGGLSDKVTDLFRINYDYGFTPTTAMLIVYEGNVYLIESIDNIREENKEVELRAIRYDTIASPLKWGDFVENIRLN